MTETNPEFDAYAFLRRYYRLWRGQEVDEIVACFSGDAVFEDLALGVRFEGPEGVRRFVEITFASVPDFAIEVQSLVRAGDHAAAAWIMTGTHLGDLPGFPATERPFEIRASSIVEFSGDKIARMSDYWNPKVLEAEAGVR